MDGARLQEKIYKGYGREAEITGYNYDVYRLNSPMTPISSDNFITTLKCAFFADAKASVANKYQTPTWMLRADGSQLQRFDILVGPFGTFFVASMQPQLPMEAIQCNSSITIARAEYQGVTVVDVPYATDLPMFKQYRREDIVKTATGELGSAITHWRAFMPLQNHTLKQGDIITDDEGINYTVDAPDFTSSGYAASIRLATL